MSRPEKNRIVKCPPAYNEFKPPGVPRHTLKQVILSLAEYEAIRLADYKGLDQVDAAKDMEISRPTFTRLINKARIKLSEVIIEGKALLIEGGNIHFKNNLIVCNDCNAVFRININTDPLECASCGSANLLNLAERFGHGRCCRGRRGRR